MSRRADIEMLVQFGRRVREIRLAKSITQERLAADAGLDRSYVGGVERGERNVSLQNIARIAKALRVPVQQLFSGQESK